ncbi:hypothetical protein T12_14773 [Trichinella patagoniensis]|uniref:Uncharacterized protein n=1 Tax=Trichinella patagoniensis TaxID=990121 RepID=A0A0V0ZWF0_9BILA|nr:hypothetical protein T12_14773 [Trichinella patagoniensis]
MEKGMSNRSEAGVSVVGKDTEAPFRCEATKVNDRSVEHVFAALQAIGASAQFQDHGEWHQPVGINYADCC